jgi:DNA-binding CsgD family transcriptional regulator
MKNILEDAFSSVLNTQNEQEFLQVLEGMGARLGFDHVLFGMWRHSADDHKVISVNNYSSSWRRRSQELSGLCAAKDPTIKQYRTSALPFAWDQEQYVAAEAGGLWEEFNAHGFSSGIAVPMRTTDGYSMALGLSRDGALPSDHQELLRVVADAQLFAMFSQPAASRLFANDAVPCDLPRLTGRELEALKWTKEGKTAWEVGRILGISERTAVFHLSNCAQKLGVSSKREAVVRAIALKIIPL